MINEANEKKSIIFANNMVSFIRRLTEIFKYNFIKLSSSIEAFIIDVLRLQLNEPCAENVRSTT